MLINESSFEFNRAVGRNFLFNNDTHLTFNPHEDTSKGLRFEDSLRLGNGMDSFVSNLFGPNQNSAPEATHMDRLSGSNGRFLERRNPIDDMSHSSNNRLSVRRRRNQNSGIGGRLNNSILSDFRSMHDNMRNLLNQLSPSNGPLIETIHITTNRQQQPFHTHSMPVSNIGIIQNRARAEPPSEFELDRRFSELQTFIRSRLPNLDDQAEGRPPARRILQTRPQVDQENENLSESNSFEMNSLDNPINDGALQHRARFDSTRQQQMRLFRVDQTSQRRLNPLDENRIESNSAHLGNQLFGHSNMFQEDLQESDSDSGLLLGDEDHFDILDHDDYSSGTDNNEDPIGVNMDGMRLPHEEDDEVVNAMEINNGFQDSRFGNLFEIGGNGPPNPDPNLMNPPLNGNPDNLPNLVFDGNQQPIEIRNIRELETVLSGNANLGPDEPIRPEHELIDDMGPAHPVEDLNPNEGNYRFSNSCHSILPDFHENMSNDFEESDPEPPVQDENLYQDSDDSEVWEDYCSCDDDQSPGRLPRKPHGRDKSLDQSGSDLNRTSSMHYLNSSKLSVESGLPRDADSQEERSFARSRNALKNVPLLTKLLFAGTQPFLGYEHSSESNLRSRRRMRRKRKVSKDLLKFQIHADIWGERYFDLLAHVCEPKYAKYPFRFPRKLRFEVVKVQVDFGSKVIAMMLSNTDYSLKTSTWTNLPVVYRSPRAKPRPSQSDSGSQAHPIITESPKGAESKPIVCEQEEAADRVRQSVLFSDIRLMVLALKKENLFWKKNLEEFNSVDFGEWDLTSLKQVLNLDDLSKTLLSRSRDFYNYPRSDPPQSRSALSSFEFHKALYWNCDMKKQNVLEKLSILKHNMFSVSSFDFIQFMGEFMRNSISQHHRSMAPLRRGKEDASDDSGTSTQEPVDQSEDLSIFEVLKTRHKLKDSKSTKVIEDKDLAYNQLRKVCDFRTEVTVESGYFNDILLGQLKKYEEKRIKDPTKKKFENKKKKLIKFARKHIGYFDLSTLDLEGAHSFLVAPEKPPAKPPVESEANNSAPVPYKFDKEFSITGPDVANPRTSILNSGFFAETYGRRNIFQSIGERMIPDPLRRANQRPAEDAPNNPSQEPSLSIQPNHNFLQRINQQRTGNAEQNQERPRQAETPTRNTAGERARPTGETPMQLHFEFNFNLTNDGPVDPNNRNNDQSNNANEQVNNANNNAETQTEPIVMENEQNAAPENGENEANEEPIEEQPNDPETGNADEAEQRENGDNIEEEADEGAPNGDANQNNNREEVVNIVRQVEQENREAVRNVFNFREIGLPDNFLEMAGIPEEVFNSYTPVIQTEIINIYATDMNLFDMPVQLAPAAPDRRLLEPRNPQPVPNNTNQHPTPNPEQGGRSANDNRNNDAPQDAPNEQENVIQEQEAENQAPNGEPARNDANLGTGDGRGAHTTPAEPTQVTENPVRAEPNVARQDINNHFLFDLDATLRQNILAEMPQEQIELLPLELRNQANRVRIERGIFPNHPQAMRNNIEFMNGGEQQRAFGRVPGRYGLGNVRVRVENGARQNSGGNRDEQEQVEMQYSGIDRVRKFLSDSREFMNKMARHNREKKFYEKLYNQKKLLVLRPSKPEIMHVWMRALGFLNSNSPLRVAFPYLMKRNSETRYNQNVLKRMQTFLDYVTLKSGRQAPESRIVVTPRERTFLKNMLNFMSESIKTHNMFYVHDKKQLQTLFELLRVVVLIDDEILNSRFLLLIIGIMRYLITENAQKRLTSSSVLIFDYTTRDSEMRTLTTLLLHPERFSNKREMLVHVFYLVDLLLLNPANGPLLMKALTNFVNCFCEKINLRFGEIKKLTFEKKVSVYDNPENRKKKKVRLTTKTLSPGDAERLEQKVAGLKTHIEYLLKIFEKLEVVFVKLVNSCSSPDHLMRFLENELVTHSIDFLQRKDSGQGPESFIEFKALILGLQKKFYEEELQNVYFRFALIFRKKNLKAMFKNMFLIFRVFEENFQRIVLDRQRLSQPLFYRLEPLFETFLIFYKMISNAEIQDFFKRELSKAVVKLKKQMKKLYKTYQTRVTQVQDQPAVRDLIAKLQESGTGDSLGKNMSIVEEQNSSVDGSADLGLFQHKKAEIKISEYKPRFNQPERSRRSGPERDPQARSSQRVEVRTRSRDESNLTENSIDRQDLSYLMAKNESATNLTESRVIKTQTLNSIRAEFDKLFRSGVKMNKKVVNHFIQSKPKIWTSAFYIIIKTLPGFITFENKRKFFRQFIQTISNRKVQRVAVNRLNLFQSAYNELGNRPKEFFHRKWNVSFNGEEGEDAGGVSREFFLNLSRAFLNPMYNYFRPASHGYAFHPSPTSTLTGVEPGVFKFIGRIVGKALFDGCYLDAHFTRAFYKQMIGHPLNYGDFEDYDPEYFKNLKWLIDNDPAPLSLTFTVEQNEFGLNREVELKPGGASIEVTQANKNEYIDLLVKHKLSDQAKKQVQEFLQGLYDVVPRNLLRIFDPKEVELMISGLPEININDLEKHTEYAGYSKDSVIIRWFWKTLRSYDTNLKAGFLQFVTGTSKVPLEGFEFLKGMGGNVQRFQIHKSFTPQNLPTSHTCMNQLDLPEYSSEEELKEKLTKAIEFGKEGFGFV